LIHSTIKATAISKAAEEIFQEVLLTHKIRVMKISCQEDRVFMKHVINLCTLKKSMPGEMITGIRFACTIIKSPKWNCKRKSKKRREIK
jgi:hypothetical protein